MDFLEETIKNLYKYLTNSDGMKTNIIRKHTKHLETLGELSFPQKPSNWKVLLDKGNDLENTNTLENINDLENIFEYLNRNEEDLIKLSENNDLKLLKILRIKDNYHLFFNKSECFKNCLVQVLKNDRFGSFELEKLKKYKKFHLESDLDNIGDVSELRVKIIMETTQNLIKFCNGIIINDNKNEDEDVFNVIFSLKSLKNKNLCLCGAVLNHEGLKDRITTSEQFIQNHIIQMRLIAEHKYGLRITSKTGWKEFFEKLGTASANIELLQNKTNSTMSLKPNDLTISNNKGSAFILYNSARLSKLLNDFEVRIASNVYPPLPPIEKIDFTLLNEPEEWELFYVYILQFPTCIKNCLKDLESCKIQPHFLVQHLSGFSNVFSAYYRRVKILTEPREHLFPILFAKVYLLKCLKIIMDNGLKLLNIEPIKQM